MGMAAESLDCHYSAGFPSPAKKCRETRSGAVSPPSLAAPSDRPLRKPRSLAGLSLWCAASYRMKMPPLVFILAIGATSTVALALSATISSAIDQSPSTEELLKTGWQIAGYSQAFDNRSTFILFRNPEQSY